MKEIFERKWLYILGYLYLLSSIIIFLLGNVKLWISIPLSIILIISTVKALKNIQDVNKELIKKNKKTIIGIGVILFFWVIVAGIGGFIWQNIWDHKFRNAVFKDLVRYDWPVTNGNFALCYYLGFWLPAALVGKIFGLGAGYLAQIVWAFIGVYIAFLIICQYLKNIKISNLLIFIFYSGLDVFLFYIFNKRIFYRINIGYARWSTYRINNNLF